MMKPSCPHCKTDPDPVSGCHANGHPCYIADTTGRFWKLSFDEVSKRETRVTAHNTQSGAYRVLAIIRPLAYVRVMMNYQVLRYGTRIVDTDFVWNPNHLSALTAHTVRMENATKVNVTNLRASTDQKKGWKQNELEKLDRRKKD